MSVQPTRSSKLTTVAVSGGGTSWAVALLASAASARTPTKRGMVITDLPVPRTRRAFVIVDWMQITADCRDETLPIKPSWFHLLPQSGHLDALTKTRRATLSARLDRSFVLLFRGISSAALRS